MHCTATGIAAIGSRLANATPPTGLARIPSAPDQNDSDASAADAGRSRPIAVTDEPSDSSAATQHTRPRRPYTHESSTGGDEFEDENEDDDVGDEDPDDMDLDD